MIQISLQTSHGLKIHQSLNEIIQGAIYSHLPPQEHEGYKNPQGRIYKSFCLSSRYFQKEGVIRIGFASFFPEHEQAIAKAVLFQTFRVGGVVCHCSQVSIESNEPEKKSESLEVEGDVVAHIKDGSSNRPIWLEPRHKKFQEIITSNLRDKYSVLTGKAYEDLLQIETLWQHPKRMHKWYKNQKIEFHPARYKITTDGEMQRFILGTGMGAKVAQGFGLVQEVRS